MAYRFSHEGHVHTLDGSPLFGTSTVIKEVMPPFLAKWGAQCAVDHIKERMGTDGTVAPSVLEAAVGAWSKTRDKAAKKGTDMHSELEAYVKKMLSDQDGRAMLLNDAATKDPHFEKVQKFAEWANDHVDRFIASEAYTYSRECWTGGVVDCVARLKTGEVAVIDFKSSREAYFNSFVQCAGYAVALGEGGALNADGVAILDENPEVSALIVVPFGGNTLRPVKVQNVEGFKDTFKHVVEVYKMLQAFKNK